MFNNISLDDVHESKSTRQILLYISLTIMLCCVILYSTLAYKVYINNRSNIFPVHIFQFNYFLGVAAKHTIGILLPLLQKIGNHLLISSCYQNYAALFFWCSSSFDIIIMQLDRLLAIRKPYWHRAEVTNSVCIKTCLSSKVLAFGSTAIVCVVTQKFNACPDQLLLLNTLPSFVLCNSAIIITALLVTIAVSIYVTLKDHELKNKVQPSSTVGLPIEVFSTSTSGHLSTLNKQKGKKRS